MLIKPQSSSLAKIKVIGIGGGGGNAINNMVNTENIEGVEFVAVNTDAAALAVNQAEIKLRIGEELTRGLGSGGDPEIGRKAAEESIDLIHENLAGADMVFLTAGMGGGTGTGAGPIIAGIARNLGALTIAIVTKPFNFEGTKRARTAEIGVNDLKDKVDTLIVIPNQRILEITERNVSFLDAMKMVDDVLGNAVKSISQLITQTGLINVDFADVKSIMTGAGTSLMGMGVGTGENRAVEAAKQAITSPLLEMDITGATGILFNVIGGKDLSLHEVDDAAHVIQDSIAEDSTVIFGATIDPDLEDEVHITVLATGFEGKQKAADSGSIPPSEKSRLSRGSEDKEDLGTEGGKSSNGEDWLETPAFLRRKKEEE